MRPEGPGTIWVSYWTLGKDDPMLGDLDGTEMPQGRRFLFADRPRTGPPAGPSLTRAAASTSSFFWCGKDLMNDRHCCVGLTCSYSRGFKRKRGRPDRMCQLHCRG